MSRKQYSVSYEDGEWRIIFEDEHIEGYPSEAAAFWGAEFIASVAHIRSADDQPTTFFPEESLCA